MNVCLGIKERFLGDVYLDVDGDGKKDLVRVYYQEHERTGKSGNCKIWKTSIAAPYVAINTGTKAKPVYTPVGNLKSIVVRNQTYSVGSNANIPAGLAVVPPPVTRFFVSGMIPYQGNNAVRCMIIALFLRAGLKGGGSHPIAMNGLHLCAQGTGASTRLVQKNP